MAFIRAFTVKDGGANLGNFYRDLIRFTTRVLLPVCFVMPCSWSGRARRRRWTPASPPTRFRAAIRPSSSARSPRRKPIKHLGTNGGGFFNANAAHPFENPTPLTNFVLIV